MKKKDYLFNMTNLILNRLRFHAPILYSTDVDFDKLIALGVDPSLPIFKFEKELSRPLFKCFQRAKSVCDFNLIITEENKRAQKKLGAILLKNNPDINKLNINYKSSSGYHLKAEENYIEINGVRQNMCLHDFFLQSSGINDEIKFYIKEFVMCGRSFYFEFVNLSNINKKIHFTINIPLERGYYYFQKKASHIEVTNLFTCDHTYFNFSSKKSKFIFSCIDGVENCTHACINVTCEASLNPKQKKVYFFNYGEQKFILSNQGEMEMFMNEADRQINERFNLRIKSKNKNEQRMLNQTLPERIYLSWLNGKNDEKSEIEYAKLKEQYLIKNERCFVFAGLENVLNLQIFDGTEWKKINVIGGEGQSYIQLGKTKFFGKNYLTLKELKNCAECLINKGI